MRLFPKPVPIPTVQQLRESDARLFRQVGMQIEDVAATIDFLYSPGGILISRCRR
jgi:hypothetical protein